MPNIIPYDDTPIVDEKAVADKHFKLVCKLKDSLYAGQAGFIKAGQYLDEIKHNKTFLSEDSSREVTWDEFLSRSDLPIGGGTPETRKRIAQRLMTVWRTFIKDKDNVDKKALSEIGYTKLALIAGVINKDPKAKLNDWLDKARELSTEDLQREISDGGMSIAETNDCTHKNYEKIDAWRCTDCKKFLKEKPDGKSK